MRSSISNRRFLGFAFGFAFAFVIVVAVQIPPVTAQEESVDAIAAKKIVEGSLEVYNTEYQPLYEANNNGFMMSSKKSNAEKSVIRKLKERDEKSLKTLRQSIDYHKRELEVAMRVEAAIVALETNPKSIEMAIEDANKNIEVIETTRKIKSKENSAEQSALRKKYEDQGKQLASVFRFLSKEQGEHELTKDLKRKDNVSGNYVDASISSYFARENDSDLSMTLAMRKRSPAQEKYGLLLGKYPIVSKGTRRITIHVGNSQLSVRGRNDIWTEENLAIAINDLINLEALEKLNPATE